MPTTPLPPWVRVMLACALAGLAAVAVIATTAGAARARTSSSSRPTPAAPSTAPSATPSAPAPGTTPSRTRPPATTSPAPTPAPGASPAGCGFFDLGCKFGEAINGFFRRLVSSALNPAFRFLARSILASPRIDQMDRIHNLWTTSAWMANTCMVLLVVIGGLVVMGHGSLQTSYTAKDIAPRLVVAVVAANVNLPLIGQAIEFANALSAAFLGPGVDEAKAANTLKSLILRSLTDAPDLFMSMLALVAVVAGVVALFTFVARVMLLVLLTVAAPLALACHALPYTDGLARLWWRAIAGVLAIQVAQALVFAAAVRVFFTSDQTSLFGIYRSADSTLDMLLVICLLYVMARIPAWVRPLIFRGMGRSPLSRLASVARALGMLLLFRGVGGKLAAARTARTPRTPPRPPGPPPALPPPPPPTPPAPPSWVQPQLPIPPSPPAGGTQLALPVTVPPQPRAARPGWTQLRLPGGATGSPRWQQTALPIRPRYIQTRLPAPPARGHIQPELPPHFPPPGSPQAGRSPRRLADAAALREAEARARRTTFINSSSNDPRRSR